VVDGLPAHVMVRHGWRREAGLVVQPGPGKRLKALCPECDVPVRHAKLNEHRTRVHGVRVPLAGSAGAAGTEAKSAKKKSSAVPSRKTKSTGRKGGGARRLTPAQPRTYTWDVDRWGSFEQERVERMSDATRGLGYARREGAHWGSTVAFDDYGDESGA
jgi:hypothetical protein